jgi:hypothetical protein
MAPSPRGDTHPADQLGDAVFYGDADWILLRGRGTAYPTVLGISFFLWIGVFNLMVIAQFWSFANDLYTPEQGKRLFAIVGFGGSVGAVLDRSSFVC